MNKKNLIKLITSLAAMIMVLGMSMSVMAAPGDVVANNGEIVCSEGAYNVTVFGKTLSVAGANATTIMPNNITAKMDAMVNGKLYKGVNRIVVLKDANRDKIVLEKGSYILDAATLTDKQVNSAVKSLIGTIIVPNDMASKTLVYTIGDNGKVLDAAGTPAATMIKTDCNYLSVDESIKVFAEEQDRLYREEIAKAEAAKNASSSSSSSSSDKPTPDPTPSELQVSYLFYGVTEAETPTSRAGRTVTIDYQNASPAFKICLVCKDDGTLPRDAEELYFKIEDENLIGSGVAILEDLSSGTNTIELPDGCDNFVLLIMGI